MSQSRRDFLKSMLGTSTVLSLSPMMPRFLQQTALASSRAVPDDSVMVVVQLSGGNDGLNTVVPYGDDAYGRNRKTLRLKDSDILTIDSLLGFHPTLTGFRKLYDAGQMSIIQGVGYAHSERDHNQALRNWHTGHPENVNCQTGWLGRASDLLDDAPDATIPNVLIAPIPLPFALNAEHAVVPRLRQVQDWALKTPGEVHAYRESLETAIQSSASGDNPLEAFVRQRTLAAFATSRQVEQVLENADRSAEYPSFTLARQFKTIAELMRAQLGVRVYFAELGGGGIGGFDNHANQRDNHAALLRELSESIAAFVADLQRDGQLNRLALMTFSEFGRTLSENGRRGTDHGAAQPVFLVGGQLQGGLIGDHPSLTDLEGDAPKFHTDFRCVYATMLERWLGFDKDAVLGSGYASLDVFS